MSFALKSFFRGLACLALLLPLPVLAQEAATDAAAAVEEEGPSFELELNSAADTSAGSCRLTYVAANNSDIALDRTAYEVAIFDSEGVVTRLLVLEFGALIEGKTKILQFDLAGTQCSSISRIVINDVAGCVQASDGEDLDFCLEDLTASSRTDIEFGL